MEQRSANFDHGSFETIDFDKLKVLVRKNLWIMIVIFFSTNLLAYLKIRWTKDIYESHSELKVEVKQDASALGLKNAVIEDQMTNIVAGEIEQMQSKLFFSRVLDSLDLWVSYYSIGNVLEFEMYRSSPFVVNYAFDDKRYFDTPIYFDFVEGGHYRVKIGEGGQEKEAVLGEEVDVDGGKVKVELAPGGEPDYNGHYFFVINSRESLLNFFEQNLKIEPINFDANTIQVSFRDFNPIKVYAIVNKIDSIYLMYSNEQKNMANSQKITWLNKELAQVEVKMENFENYFEDFTLKNKSSDLSSDLRATIILINRLDSQRFELAKKIEDIDALTKDLLGGKLSATLMPRVYLPQFVNANIEQYQKILQDQDRLTLSYKDNTLAYKRKDQEVSALKTKLFDQVTELKKNWVSSLSELNQKKDKLEQKFATMPDKNTQYSKNQRFYKLYEEFYLSMMQAKAEFEIAQAGSTPDLKILSSAILPYAPIAPNRLMILGIGFVAGILLNLLFIGFIYVINDKITSLQEIEKFTRVPVLGVVPQMKNSIRTPFYIVEHPRSVVSEAIRTLRTNLDFFTSIDKKKVIAISSTVSGEGKSFLASNLGGVLALSKKRVILLDLDMRKSKDEAESLSVDRQVGMSTILINRNTIQDCIIHTSVEGLDMIPSGPHPPNPSELLLNGEFESVLAELRQTYDYVVIDTPPVGLVTDGIMAMRRADLSIYVVRANYSDKEFLKNMERVTTINKLSNMAIVLNALPASGKTYGYGYYQDDRKNGTWLKKLLNK